jgi:hypothetical protein
MTSAFELESSDGPFGPGLTVPEHFKRVAKDPLAGWTCMSPAPISDPDRVYPEVWAAIVREATREPEPVWEDEDTWRARLERWRAEIRKRWRQ